MHSFVFFYAREHVLSMGILSVCHDPVWIRGHVR